MSDNGRARRAGAIGLLIGLLIASAPAIARVVADYARNAGKVDGFSAIAGENARRKLSEKLIATDEDGYLPNEIIRRAPDARRLSNEIPQYYADTRCEMGLAADALVPADVPADPTPVGDAFVFSGKGRHGDPLTYDCVQKDVLARRVAPGTYRLNFAHAATCSIIEGAFSVVLSVKSDGVPLVATSHTVCEDDESEEEVEIRDLDGVPRDASFTILLLTSLPQPQFP